MAAVISKNLKQPRIHPMSKMKFELNLNHLKHTNLNQCSTRVLCLELLTELIPTYFISSLSHSNYKFPFPIHNCSPTIHGIEEVIIKIWNKTAFSDYSLTLCQNLHGLFFIFISHKLSCIKQIRIEVLSPKVVS